MQHLVQHYTRKPIGLSLILGNFQSGIRRRYDQVSNGGLQFFNAEPCSHKQFLLKSASSDRNGLRIAAAKPVPK